MFKYLKELFSSKSPVAPVVVSKPILQPSSKVKSDRVEQNQTPAIKPVKKATVPHVNKTTTKQPNSKKK